MASWTQQANLPVAVGRPIAWAMGQRVFFAGGSSDGTAAGINSAVYSAKVEGDGSIKGWDRAGALPSMGVMYAKAVTFKDKVYILGGYDGTGAVNQLVIGRCSQDGKFDVVKTTAMPIAGALWNAAIAKGYLYLFFYWPVSTTPANPSCWRSRIGSDGLLGPWETQTANSAAHSYWGAASGTLHGRLFVIGGGTQGGSDPGLYSSKLTSDGRISTWARTDGLPTATGVDNRLQVTYSAHVFSDKHGGVFMLAGNSTTSTTGSKLATFHKLDRDGKITKSINLPDLPVLRRTAAAALAGDYLVMMGGRDSGGPTSNFKTVHTLKISTLLPPAP